MDDPIVGASALKHGVGEQDILHAYRNPIRAWHLDDDFLMIVGAGRTGSPIEVGLVRGTEAPIIIHAMPARAKFLR